MIVSRSIACAIALRTANSCVKPKAQFNETNSIAGAMFFGILASLLPGGRKTAVEAAVVEKKAETFEEVVAATDAKAVPATADASAPVKTDDAKPEAVKDAGNDTVKTDAKAEAAVTATPPADAPRRGRGSSRD